LFQALKDSGFPRKICTANRFNPANCLIISMSLVIHASNDGTDSSGLLLEDSCLGSLTVTHTTLILT